MLHSQLVRILERKSKVSRDRLEKETFQVNSKKPTVKKEASQKKAEIVCGPWTGKRESECYIRIDLDPSNGKRKDTRSVADRRRICLYCKALKSRTRAWWSCTSTRSVNIRAQCWKRRDFLLRLTTKSWQCIHNARRWRSRCQKSTLLIPGPLDESDKPDLRAKVMEEFEVAQVTHTTIVMVNQLCQKVQELTSGPAGSHQIGSEVYSQGLPLSQEDLRIIGGSKFTSKRYFQGSSLAWLWRYAAQGRPLLW